MVSPRTRFALLAGRTAGRASRALGRGAGQQVSGRIMNRLDPDALRELGTGRRIAIVSATNGKTTTTALLAAAIAAQGEAVASNTTGANLAAGCAAALAANPDAEWAVLEVDERAVPAVFEALRPELLVLGNLSRDQLDRYGEVSSIAHRWRTLLDAHPDTTVVANASDPAVVWAAQPANTTFVDLGLHWREDSATCPQCGALMQWSAHRFDCTACGFAQPDAVATLTDGALTVDGTRLTLNVALPGRWNECNAALAIVAARALGIRPAHAAAAVASVTTVSGRYATYELGDGRPVRVFLAKNPAGWSEVLHYLEGSDDGVVLAVNAHIADGRDPSWLWDVPYELLRGRDVVAAGERALDVAVRLYYAEVSHRIETDPILAATLIDADRIDIVASYTNFHALTRRFGSSAT
ncbi:MAG: MurT ligase domain-containing protein [Acidimicrobiia bacterium]